MASSSDVVRKRGKSSISNHLKCSVCLEVFKSPRALACLHTFCETCIQSCITKEAEEVFNLSSIKCPVCMKATPAPKPMDPPRGWARNLPLNYVIVPLLESLGSERERRRLCDNCTVKNKSAVATSFCSQCDQFQCVDCLNLHNKLSALKTHIIVEVGEASRDTKPSVNLGKLEYCQEHTEKVKFYCIDHREFLCSSCAIVNHRPCRRVVEIKQAGRDVRLQEKSQKLLNKMDNLQTQLSAISQYLEANIGDIDKQAADIVQKTKSVRDRVVEMLDNIVRNVSAKCSEIKKEETTRLSDTFTRQRCVVAAIASSRTFLESVLKQGTDSQIFLAFDKIESQLTDYERQVSDESQRTAKVEIHLELDAAVKSVLKATGTLASVIVTRIKPKGKVCKAERVSLRKDTGTEVDRPLNGGGIKQTFDILKTRARQADQSAKASRSSDAWIKSQDERI